MSSEKSEIYTNRLEKEKSPYLLQHAHNPVDWYPWGEEAFAEAKKQDKPVFLSIGYSTCHWCHVMEKESFENPQVAKVMNDHFISIKVDREERPDVDAVYMQAVMAMTGSGGWPMSVFLTPDLKPFYGGTYFPPQNQMGRPGFITVLSSLAEKWKTEKDKIEAAGQKLTDELSKHIQNKVQGSAEINESLLERAYKDFESRFDADYGGFGEAPKFPSSHNLSFLLQYQSKTGQDYTLVEKSLTEMAKGGIFDHLGGGFHRYSTDAKWHVPHFEKMLYDQANISRTYVEAYQITGNDYYASIASRVLDYVLSQMTDVQGGFYSAEDADSISPDDPNKKSEGAFYIWSKDELRSILGDEDAEIVSLYYGVTETGNAENDPMGEFTGRNIFYVARSQEEIAKKLGIKVDQVKNTIKKSVEILFRKREERPRPHLDDKVLTDWNGFMISSLAYAGRVLNESRYTDAAKKAAAFITRELLVNDVDLLHRWREGESGIHGFLDDYAYFSLGLLELYQTTYDVTYLRLADKLLREMTVKFWDSENKGFVFVGKDAEKLITVNKELYDGAIPSGNSIATLALLKASRLMLNKEFEKTANENIEYFSTLVDRFPSGFTQMLMSISLVLGPSTEIVIAEGENGEVFNAMVNEVNRQWLPHKVQAVLPRDKESRDVLKMISPFITKQIALNGKTTAYVCQDHNCEFPVTEVTKLRQLLTR